jgi:hypothetical protein
MIMQTASEQRTIRVAPWLIVCAAIAALLFLAGLVGALLLGGVNRMALGFAGLCVVGALGVADVGTRRVVLSPDGLSVISIWSRRAYPRDGIDSVAWEGGIGVAVKLTSGGWVKLPELGRNSQSVSNMIRAWLKRTGEQS